METEQERIDRLHGLRAHRPLTFERMVAAGQITADDLAKLNVHGAGDVPVDG